MAYTHHPSASTTLASGNFIPSFQVQGTITWQWMSSHRWSPTPAANAKWAICSRGMFICCDVLCFGPQDSRIWEPGNTSGKRSTTASERRWNNASHNSHPAATMGLMRTSPFQSRHTNLDSVTPADFKLCQISNQIRHSAESRDISHLSVLGRWWAEHPTFFGESWSLPTKVTCNNCNMKICEDLWRSVKCKVRAVQHVQLQPLLRIRINISNWSGLVRASDSKLPSQRTLDWNWIARSCSLNILFPLRICTYDRSETSPKQGTLPQWAKHSKTTFHDVSWQYPGFSWLLHRSVWWIVLWCLLWT